ncbi:hypothetical protein HS125_13440 [bacterium]|nr:hypothetical protein [bacterium]
MQSFVRQVAVDLAPLLKRSVQQTVALLEQPADSSHGDLALPCFILSRGRRPRAQQGRRQARRPTLGR